MFGEFLLRFVLGGTIVSLFAVLSDMVSPKTFAGIFGAAPSVALASLGLAFATGGVSKAALDGRSMLAGAVALLAYSLLVQHLVMRRRWPTMLAASVLLLLWLAIALALWAIALR
ncbi:MAG TPA: DUF3147 family protein [Chloroflexota bacterium]|nr:DUF3147 family protein [Chloroflexota bacterium]